MHLDPLSVVHFAAILAVKPTDIAAGAKARRVYSEVCFYTFRGKLLAVMRLLRTSVSSGFAM